jgi:hypothetical protein
MLSPTRSSAQTILKAVVTTASTVFQESASTSVEQKEESNDTDDNEPSKKKFKDDTETEVNIEELFHLGILNLLQVETSITTTQVRPRPPKKRKACVSFGYCGMFKYSIRIISIFSFRCWILWSSTVKNDFIFSMELFVFRNAKDKVHRTIEDELVEAFVKVGAIPQAHADDMSKVISIHRLFNKKCLFFCFRWDFKEPLELIKVYQLLLISFH